jgi:hypothetical protein
MHRRTLLSAGLLAIPLDAVARQAAPPHLTVINVAARDCLYCVAWTIQSKPAWLESREYRLVRYAEIDAPTVKRAYEAEYWGDLAGVIDKLPRRSGTPRFLLVRDGDVVFNQFGMSGWPKLLDELRTRHLA